MAHLLAFDALQSASTVLIYLPMRDEIDVTALVTSPELSAVGTGRRFVTTRTPDGLGGLSVHELGGEMETHHLGFPQPTKSAREVAAFEINVLLLPGLAFDRFGNRLGRGMGYFDRLLAEVRPDATIVGLVPAELVVDRLPVEAHDRSVERLATEDGVVATGDLTR